jgi:hypothetical protein
MQLSQACHWTACNAKRTYAQVFLRDDKLRWWHKHSRAHHENWLKKFFGQPCNGELFVKQSINMESAPLLLCSNTGAGAVCKPIVASRMLT